jgi:chromosome partitioning protein
MIISILSLKGGVGKTTSAMHLAAVVHREAKQVAVLDGDEETSGMSWAAFAAQQDKPLPFDVIKGSRNGLAKQARELEQAGAVVVIDAPPNNREVLTVAGMLANFVIVPVVPTGLDVDRLRNTLEVISNIEATRGSLSYAVLLTRFSGAKTQAREALKALGVLSMFDSRIRSLTAYEKAFGSTPSYLEEYQGVWNEVKEALGV